MCVRVLSIRFCLSYGRSDTKAISRNVKKESCHFRKCMLVCTHVCTQFQCKSNNLLLIKRIWCACASVCGVCILITRTLSTGVVPFTWSLIAIHLYSWYAVFVIRLSHAIWTKCVMIVRANSTRQHRITRYIQHVTK